MELFLLFLVPLALGSLFIGGGSDEDGGDTAPEPQPETVNGTDDADLMRGTGEADAIDGGDGGDLLFGYGGADTLAGGDGQDLIDGGNGNDVINGGAEDDWLAGANGNDSMNGDAGQDVLFGGAGDDTLNGGSGDDALIGSTGADHLYGGSGDDYLNGVSPDPSDPSVPAIDADTRDELTSAIKGRFGDDATNADIQRFMRDLASQAGDHAPDALEGGAGSDWLYGDNGDTMTGGSELDTFEISHTLGNAPVTITDYDPNEGLHVTTYGTHAASDEFGLRDAADGSGAELALNGEVIANLTGLSAASLSTGEITLRYADNLDAVYSATHLGETTPAVGTDGNDLFRGTSAGDTFDGGAGNDLLFGRNGADTLAGGADQDLIDGGNGNDVLSGGADFDWLAGGNGDDSIDGGGGRDILTGGAGDDTMLGGGGDDFLLGSTGADQMYGGSGDDFLDGVSPTNGQSLADAFNVDERGEITQTFETNFGDAATADDIDRFMRDLSSQDGVDAPDALYGGAGQDILAGNDGDTLTGGADEDLFIVPWQEGDDPVTITDYSAVDETILVQITGDVTAAYDFGLRDAANGSGVEVLLEGDVVANLTGLSTASLNTGLIQLQVLQGDDFINQSAVILPALAA
ncbi:calcium-binding protein [Pseudorhodobacter sp. W20_MBD10_FR17]|uniref:calcium-binding protein n=1 Tax=Pseudorhodobacter sp. W20_MBD10_FR17 TaxID=3240266 RepID=UPI003F9C06F3